MKTKVDNRKILIVEDDPELSKAITRRFSVRNIVFTVTDVDAALAILKREKDIDAVILDLILPHGSGLDLFQSFSDLPPVIILSTLDSDEQIVTGLKAGAVDYVAKPCSLELLETRVAIRLLPKKDAYIRYGEFSIDANLRLVCYSGVPISLTSSEFNILFFLVRHPDDYFTADEIYESVWGAPSLHTTTIRSHLSFLRRKLKAAAPDINLIYTDFGKGYTFSPPLPLSGHTEK